MSDEKKAPEVFDSSHGHQWAKWEFASITMVCCNLCGIVRRRDDNNKPCRGKVKVALREGFHTPTPEAS